MKCVIRLSSPSQDLPRDQARAYQQVINDVLVRARRLVNSFHAAARTPPEILGMISSHLTEDVFSASQVCHHWRSVLISYPSLWTRISCRRAHRTIISLERCDSLPIRLRLEPRFSTAALENVRLHGKKIASLIVTRGDGRIPQLHHLIRCFNSSMEQLHIYCTIPTIPVCHGHRDPCRVPNVTTVSSHQGVCRPLGSNENLSSAPLTGLR